jgi:hypothetical protein
VPILGHPVAGPDRDRPEAMDHALETSVNAFAITFADRIPASDTN